jgi:hypothetical protein
MAHVVTCCKNQQLAIYFLAVVFLRLNSERVDTDDEKCDDTVSVGVSFSPSSSPSYSHSPSFILILIPHSHPVLSWD